MNIEQKIKNDFTYNAEFYRVYCTSVIYMNQFSAQKIKFPNLGRSFYITES